LQENGCPAISKGNEIIATAVRELNKKREQKVQHAQPPGQALPHFHTLEQTSRLGDDAVIVTTPRAANVLVRKKYSPLFHNGNQAES
jgi:hypothetical protein